MPDPSPPQTYPVQAIARLLKLSERRVQQLVKDGILPRPVKGEYDAINCVHAYIDYLKKLISGSGELSLTDERTRLTKYQADLAELDLRRAHGEVIGTEDAMRIWSEVVMAVRQRLLALPTRMAPLVVNCQSIPEVKARLDVAITEVLGELTSPDLGEFATHQSRRGSRQEDAKTLRASAAADGKRVGRQKETPERGVERGTGPVENGEGRVPEGDDGRLQ